MGTSAPGGRIAMRPFGMGERINRIRYETLAHLQELGVALVRKTLAHDRPLT